MSDETKIFTKNDKNGDKCASGGPESGLKLIFERGVAILVRPWRFPGQPKKFVFFSIKVGTINSGTSLDSREQFKKTGKLEIQHLRQFYQNRRCLKHFHHLFPSDPLHISCGDLAHRASRSCPFGILCTEIIVILFSAFPRIGRHHCAIAVSAA